MGMADLEARRDKPWWEWDSILKEAFPSAEAGTQAGEKVTPLWMLAGLVNAKKEGRWNHG